MHNFPIVVSSRMVAVSRHQYQLRAVPLFKPPNVFFTYLHPPVGVSWLDYPTLPKQASRQGTPTGGSWYNMEVGFVRSDL